MTIALLIASAIGFEQRLLYMSIPDTVKEDTSTIPGIVKLKTTISFNFTIIAKRSDTTQWLATNVAIKTGVTTIPRYNYGFGDTNGVWANYLVHVGKGYWLGEFKVIDLDVTHSAGEWYIYIGSSTLLRKVYGVPTSGPLDTSNTIVRHISVWCDGVPTVNCSGYIGTDSLGWKPNLPSTSTEVDPKLSATERPVGVKGIYTVSGKKVHTTDLTKVPMGVYVVMPITGKPYVKRIVR